MMPSDTNGPSPSPWLERLFIVLGAITPLVGAVAPLGLAPILIIAALAVVMMHGPGRLILALPRWPLAFSIAFLAWGLASALWAIEPARVVYKTGQLAVLFFSGLVLVTATRELSTSARGKAGSALLVSLVATGVLFAFEVGFRAPLSGFLVKPPNDLPLLITYYNRGATVAALLMVPTALLVAQRYGWRWSVAFAAGGVAALAILNSRSALGGAILGLLVAVIALRWPTVMLRLVAIGVALLLLLMPVVPGVALSSPERNVFLSSEGSHYKILSLYHRFRIWEFTVEKIDERPLFGWGLDSSRRLPGGQARTDAGGGERLALHPHNAPLQIRVELGLPAIILAICLVLWPIALARRLPAQGAATVSGVVVAAFVVASMSYGIWQSWWFATLWIIAALTSLMLPQRVET